MEFKGKTVEEAVEKALKELNLERNEVEVEVLEEKKGLFGTKVVVDVTKKDLETEEETVSVAEEVATNTVENTRENGAKTDGERTVAFLDGLFEILKIKAVSEVVSEGEKIVINVTAANSNAVIGKRGVMLDSIQALAGAVANTGRDEYKRVVVDCENYRSSRENTLENLAEKLADKAVRTGRKIKLEPMNPYERRIIHSSISGREDVKTVSEGKEPNRYIVIVPANEEDPTLPALEARNERRDNRRRGGKGGNKGGYNKNKGGFNKGGNRGFNKRSGGGKPSDSSNGGTSLKNTDFFGIFLGNSGNKDE